MTSNQMAHWKSNLKKKGFTVIILRKTFIVHTKMCLMMYISESGSQFGIHNFSQSGHGDHARELAQFAVNCDTYSLTYCDTSRS